MQLQALAQGTGSVSRLAIANKPDLARDIQAGLTRLGLLDGPPDGKFGPVSNWALDAFLAARAPTATAIDAAVARELLNGAPWPFKPGTDYAGRVARRMKDLGHFISRYPDCVNIVYIEGVFPDGTPSGNKPNRFDDTRMILPIRADGVPEAETWEATTEPGRAVTINPLCSLGAARRAGRAGAPSASSSTSSPRAAA
jgi:peptidoglycan hydrolase-like protein with peptidoglycan-binding domain